MVFAFAPIVGLLLGLSNITVMLSVVRIVNASRGWYEAADRPQRGLL